MEKTQNRIFENVIQAIGNTPIVKLNKVAAGLPANLYVKLEFMNPGGSIKDRIGYWLIEDAEKRGALKPGGTIVECTSGNTGVGLAIAAAIKGYKCVFVLPDKMSNEKIQNLRAFGARVVVTPTAVEAADPRSYYSVAKRIAAETPNAIHIHQYDNLANRECHQKMTGPEILEQMPQIDGFIAGIGTGGTLCGVGRYLKEKKPSCQVVGVDPVGSIVYEYFKTGKIESWPKTYKIEGIGEDFIPKNYDLSVVDEMVQVEDKESFLMTRELLMKEGLYGGISCGSAVVGAIKYVKALGDKAKGKNYLIVLPDSGNRYMSKVFNDDWMREAGFLEDTSLGKVSDLLAARGPSGAEIVMVKPGEKVSRVIEIMKEKGISQMPVSDEGGWIKGVVSEGGLLSALYSGRIQSNSAIENVMSSAIEFVTPSDPIEKISKLVSAGKVPLVTDPSNKDKVLAILTTIDLVSYLGNRR